MDVGICKGFGGSVRKYERSCNRRGRQWGGVETVTWRRQSESAQREALALKGAGLVVFWAVTNPDKVLDLLTAVFRFLGL